MASYRLGRCLLSDLLDRRKMTQQQLAERVGMSKQQINNYISGRTNMSLANAMAIAKALGCHVEDLYELIQVRPG
jgi:transcriptional regulator with XRE-family HTH domain